VLVVSHFIILAAYAFRSIREIAIDQMISDNLLKFIVKKILQNSKKIIKKPFVNEKLTFVS
jgi:hypothetical protein